MKKTLAATAMSLAMVAGTATVALANDPIDPVPLAGTFLYELDFNPYDGSGVSGKGSLVVPDAGTGGPTLSIEIDNLAPDTKYKVRFGGPEDADSNFTKCSRGPGALGPLNGDNSEFQIGGASLDTGPEGVLRWDYDVMAPFTGDRVLEVNNGEPVIVVTEINANQTEGDIVACAELGGIGNALPNPTDRAYPVALVGGQNPVRVNGSDITARGQVNLIGTRVTYDITLTGDSLIDSGAGLQNHIVLLRSTSSCASTIDTAMSQSVAALTNFRRSTEAPSVKSDLIDIFPRSPINFTGKQLKIQGSVTLPGVSGSNFGNYGIVVLGLEEGGLDRPANLKGLQSREATPSACLTLVDKASEVGPPAPVTVAEAVTIDELTKASDFRSSPDNKGTDQEIMRLYAAFFNRTPDVAGVQYWISVSKGQVDGRTYTTKEIAEFFEPTTEFQNSFETVGNAQFVETVYSNVLARTPEAEGLAYWNDILNGTNLSGANPENKQAKNRGELVFFVAINDEFVNRLPYSAG